MEESEVVVDDDVQSKNEQFESFQRKSFSRSDIKKKSFLENDLTAVAKSPHRVTFTQG